MSESIGDSEPTGKRGDVPGTDDLIDSAEQVEFAADDREVEAALEAVEYSYTDPVDDPDYPLITDYDPEDPPDAFPDTWGQELTERDQAAIDSGAAEEAVQMAESASGGA